MKNVCLYCKEPLIGRSDKKFCNDQCRITFHNSKVNEKENVIKDVNKVLRKNRSILKFASPMGKTTVKKSFLTRHGFDFSFYTNHFKTNNGNVYTFCYDYGYLDLDGDKILVINKQLYM